MRAIAIIVVTLSVAGCNALIEQPGPRQFSGSYSYGFEVSKFVPKGSNDMWWLSGSVPCLAIGQPMYLELQGALSSKGRYGHLGAYSRELQVNSVSVCQVSKANEGIQ